MELPFDSPILLLGLYLKNPESPVQKNLCTPMFTAAQFTIAKYWKQPKCPPANEWIKKLWYIYTMEFYAAERKKELILFATYIFLIFKVILYKITVKNTKYKIALQCFFVLIGKHYSDGTRNIMERTTLKYLYNEKENQHL